MKNTLIQWRRHWSTWTIIGFGVLLFFVAIFAELFQAPPLPPQEITKMVQNPIPSAAIEKMIELKMTNKNGTFILKNLNPNYESSGPWLMESPQKTKVKSGVVEKIIKSLDSLYIRNIHRLEPINLKSFSLDKPSCEIKWTHPLSAPLEVKFGLINPIDNSLYFTFSDQKWIYQSTLPEATFDQIGLNDLIDTHILFIQTDRLVKAEIWKNPFDIPQISIIRNNDGWMSEDGQQFKTDKVLSFFERIQKMKSYMILDKVESENQPSLQELLIKPAYKLVFTYTDRLETYFLSQTTDHIGSLKFDKGSSFLFYSQGSPTPLIISKEYLSSLLLKPNDLR
jgi:hypothetical protein